MNAPSDEMTQYTQGCQMAWRHSENLKWWAMTDAPELTSELMVTGQSIFETNPEDRL